MAPQISAPPAILDSAQVLFYADTGGEAAYTGRLIVLTGTARDLREVGPVPRLAICENLGAGELLILHCDSCWNVLAAESASTVQEARSRAERAYAGISSRWTPYRELTHEELREIEREREAIRKLMRQHPLDGNDPPVA